MKNARRVTLLSLVSLLILCILPISALAFDNTGWYWPVPDSLSLSRGFSDGHQGLDITGSSNVAVMAARSGTVIAVYEGCTQWDGYGKNHSGCNPVAHLTTGDQWGIRWYQDDGGTNVCNYGIGNGVVIDHGSGVWTEYSHMASVNVSVGQHVDGGTQIGTMGSYGNSTGRHLHFSIRTDAYMSSGGYPHGNAVNSNAYGAEYVIYGSWNGVDNIYYSRSYPTPNAQPNISLDSATGGNGTVTVRGWAYDPDDVSASLSIHVYAKDGAGNATFVGSTVANKSRPDVHSAYGCGNNHGFEATFDTSLVGTFTIQAAALDTAEGGNKATWREIGNVRIDRVTVGKLEVRGFLDGQNSDTTEGYGTFDVYIGDTKVADDASYYSNSQVDIGESYVIDDIRPVGEHTYEGAQSGSTNGTMTADGALIRLSFNSFGRLKVVGVLDGAASDSIQGFGTYDVYIDGEAKATGASEYTGSWPNGATYEIRNIRAADGKYFEGAVVGNTSGTLDNGQTQISLSFITKIQAGSDWREISELPVYIDESTVEIEYNNHYESRAASSPGTGWTQVPGSGVTTYENDGGVYESDFPLETSNTRVLVGSYHYHYCGASKGEDVEHYQDSGHTDYHQCGVDNLYVDDQWNDYADSRYICYKLRWSSGQWAGGLATCAAGRSAVWYRRYQYQNRRAVTTYTWTKDSGWTATADSSAKSVSIRFRLKRYSVSFDANGGEGAPESQVKYHGIDLALTEALPVKALYRFTGWNTQADGKGAAYAAGGSYTGDADVTLYAQWEAQTRLALPSDLLTIEERAFEGIGAVIVEVPDGCASIGTQAFLNCANLERIYIPASVANIAFDAFEGCDKVTVCAPDGSTAIRLAKALGLNYEITG